MTHLQKSGRRECCWNILLFSCSHMPSVKTRHSDICTYNVPTMYSRCAHNGKKDLCINSVIASRRYVHKTSRGVSGRFFFPVCCCNIDVGAGVSGVWPVYGHQRGPRLYPGAFVCRGRSLLHIWFLFSRTVVYIIIIIMVISKCYFSGEHIALSFFLKQQRCEHRIRKNKQIKSTVHDAN